MNPLPAIANHRDGGAAASESMRAATDFAISVGGTSDIEVLPDWLDVWNKYVLPGATSSAGPGRILNSRLVPRDRFATEEGISQIMGYIGNLTNLGFNPKTLYAPVGTPFVANSTIGRRPDDDQDDHGTSINPSWYSALWELGYGSDITWNSTYEQRLQSFTVLADVARQSVELSGPDSAAYFNEANPFLEDWREAWWGDNYEFLLETKRKYDPSGILKCWKCIGFEDEDVGSDRFRCQGKLQAQLTASSKGQQ
jgi:hypothetical protein